MQLILRREKVWGVVNGTEVRPEGSTGGKSKASETDLIDAWTEKDEKAFVTLCLAISISEQVHIRSCSTSAQVWNKLAEVYEGDALPRKMQLWRKFFSLKFQEGTETLQDYVNKAVTLMDQLTAVGETITENMVVAQILHNLPESYDNLVVAIESRDDIPTIEQLRGRLIQEELRRNEHASNRSGDTALYTKQKGKHHHQGKPGGHQGSSERSNANIKCFHCGKLGHKKAECRKRIAEGKAEGKADVKTDSLLFAAAFSLSSDEDKWFVDSGATGHFCSRRDWFREYTPTSESKIKLADNNTITIKGKGAIKVEIEVDGKNHEYVIDDVSYVPDLSGNLLSVKKLTEKGYEVNFKGSTCRILKGNGQIVAIANMEGNLYRLKVQVQAPRNAAHLTQTDKASIGLWHRRLGHLGADGVRQLVAKNLVSGIDVDKNDQLALCKGCTYGKQLRTPFPTEKATRAKDILEIIHTDVCGPLDVPSYGGSRYFVTFVDDKSHKIFVYFLKTKDEVLGKFRDFKTMAEKQTGKVIKILRSDNGGEYVSRAFENYLRSQGICHQKTVPYTPEQNGVAERANRTIVERVRSMLHDRGLLKELWAEAASTAVYLINRSPTKALVDMTPEEAWTGTKPSIFHIRTFGCKAYAHVPKQKRTKLDSKATECAFIGYPDGTKGYKLFNLSTKAIFTSRDVIFDEQDVGNEQEIGNEQDVRKPQEVEFVDTIDENSTHEDDHDDDSDRDDNDENDDRPDDDRVQDQEDVEAIKPEEQDEPNEVEEPDEVTHRRSNRERKQPARYTDYVLLASSLEGEPTTYTEAMNAPDASKWEQAAKEEYKSLIKNKTWQLVDLPRNRKAIGCKWVFKAKRNALGEIDRYKARLVAKGFSQTQGIDYDETFAPVAKFNSIRTLIALAAEHDLELHQMDVKTAFLNGNLEEDIYMQQPEGFVKKGEQNKVCKLQRSLYGLKQAGRAWYQMIDNTLIQMGFKRTHADNCIYVFNKDGVLMIMAIYVDDLIMLANNLQSLNALKAELGRKFEMKDLGEAHFCLGIQIVRNRAKKTISINQRQYIENILKRFNMSDCKPVGTPMDANTKFFKKSDDNDGGCDEKLYQQAIGSLMYAMLGTRPDTAFAVGALSRFNSNPGRLHWQAVKRVFRYLQGTKGHSLEYRANGKPLVGFCDADWAGDVDDRRSTTGYTFILAGGAVSWSSKKQQTVALSTTEAEYMSLTQATKEGIWIQRFLEEIGFGSAAPHPTTIYDDNQGCIALSRNSVYHARTKHIDVRHHFVREKVEAKEVDVRFCGTDEMIADVMTKALANVKHEYFTSLLGLNHSS